MRRGQTKPAAQSLHQVSSADHSLWRHCCRCAAGCPEAVQWSSGSPGRRRRPATGALPQPGCWAGCLPAAAAVQAQLGQVGAGRQSVRGGRPRQARVAHQLLWHREGEHGKRGGMKGGALASVFHQVQVLPAACRAHRPLQAPHLPPLGRRRRCPPAALVGIVAQLIGVPPEVRLAAVEQRPAARAGQGCGAAAELALPRRGPHGGGCGLVPEIKEAMLSCPATPESTALERSRVSTRAAPAVSNCSPWAPAPARSGAPGMSAKPDGHAHGREGHRALQRSLVFVLGLCLSCLLWSLTGPHSARKTAGKARKISEEALEELARGLAARGGRWVLQPPSAGWEAAPHWGPTAQPSTRGGKYVIVAVPSVLPEQLNVLAATLRRWSPATQLVLFAPDGVDGTGLSAAAGGLGAWHAGGRQAGGVLLPWFRCMMGAQVLPAAS